MKQETLEEAAKRFVENTRLKNPISIFCEGAKWQVERMYSEEDMQEYAEFCIRCYNKGLPCIIAKDWFEQFKNK